MEASIKISKKAWEATLWQSQKPVSVGSSAKAMNEEVRIKLKLQWRPQVAGVQEYGMSTEESHRQ
jgi:hypothetical protein